VEQLIAGKDASGAQGQEVQQVELEARQLDPAAVAFDDAARGVDDERAAPQWLPLLPSPRAAQQGAHPRHELARAEGFRQVVVGADLEAEDLVRLFPARGEHQDRDIALPADAAADLEPVRGRDHEVQNDEGRPLARELPQRRLAVRHDPAGEAGRLEVLLDEPRDLRVVLDDEHRGRHGPRVGRATARVKVRARRRDASRVRDCGRDPAALPGRSRTGLSGS